MLVNVAARPLEPQLEPNGDAPKRPGWPMKLERCGILPARSLDSKAALLEFVAALLNAVSAADVGLKGLVEGVGREVFEAVWGILTPFMTPAGDILEGKVPARPRRAGLLIPLSVKGTRLGKPS